MIIDGNAIDPVPKVTGRAKTRPVGEPVRDEGAEQKMQQAFGGSAARPTVPVEHAMEIGEARYRAQPQDAQGRGDGPPSGRQDGAGEQHQQVSPGRSGEQGLERCQPSAEDVRSGRLGHHERGPRWLAPSGNPPKAQEG
jgi:hypothetical protein